MSATNNRIPERLPCPTPCVTGAMRGAATTVDNGLEGGVLIDAAAGNVAVHVDAFGRKADDYRIPSYPYLFVPGPAVQRQAAELGSARRYAIRRRVVHLQRGLRWARGDAEQCPLRHSRHRWRGA